MEYRETGQLDPPVELRYRPYLDGLRCVAVYLVVAFHAGLGSFSGGFIGVDVFFVLSGFLVTRILLGDLVSAGRINFRRFYSRRFRRILPAAAVMLLVTAVAYVIVRVAAAGVHRGGRLPSRLLVLRELALYSTIHQLLRDERQLESGAAFLVTRGRGTVLFDLAAAAQRPVPRCASGRSPPMVGVTCRGLRSDPGVGHRGAHDRCAPGQPRYYGTDTRAYQLLAGALLALTPQLFELGSRYARLARVAAPVALGAIVVLASSILKMTAITAVLSWWS